MSIAALRRLIRKRNPYKSPTDGRFVSKPGGATVAASSSGLRRTTERAFNGDPVELKTKLSKQAAGALGEKLILDYLRDQGQGDARAMNTKYNNFPVDGMYDHRAVEMKTGMASNSRSAQQWRMTIGEPGVAEKEWLKTASPDDKAAWNKKKQQAIHDRKQKVLDEVTRITGQQVKGETIATILNPDTKTVDIYRFEGYHDRIPWRSDQAAAAYQGSFNYD